MGQEKVQAISLEQMFPDERNRRVGGFNQEKLEELAESIKAVGVLQPALVRPARIQAGEPAPEAPRFEIVAGERRWRAAKIAGLSTLPCVVRDLDDLAVLKIRGIENLQREDLHPLDEADWYARLLEQGGYDVEALAKEAGKSASYVYQRLKLKDLAEPARAAFVEGKLSAGHAILIARLTPEDQGQALEATLEWQWDGELMPVRKLAEWIQAELFMELSCVSWKLDDGELLPAAGSCRACPKRTGFRPEAFADVCKDKKDYCTDRACFEGMAQAMVARQREALGEDKHLEVCGGGGRPSAGVVSSYEWSECKKKDKGAERVLVVEGRGAGRLTWGRKDSRVGSYKPSPAQLAREEARKKEEARKRALAIAYPRALWEKCLSAVRKKLSGGKPVPEALMRLVLLQIWNQIQDNHRQLFCKQEGWAAEKKEKSEYGTPWKGTGQVNLLRAKRQDLPLVLVKLALIWQLDVPTYDSSWKPHGLEACAKLMRVDSAAVKAAVQAEARLKEKTRKGRVKCGPESEDKSKPEGPLELEKEEDLEEEEEDRELGAEEA